MFLLSLTLLSVGCGGKKKPHDDSPSVTVIPGPIPLPEPDPIPPIIIEDPVPQPVPTPAPVEPPPGNPPSQADSFKVNVTLLNSTPARTAKYNQAVVIFKKVIAMQAFKDAVLTHKYNGSIGYSSTSRSPAYIYQNILDGDEKLTPEKNNALDIEVQFYYENSTIIGYTYGNIKRIYVNTKYFDTFKPSSVAGNLMHEWCHKLGYDHDVSRTTRRPYSVPYALGNMMSTLGTQFN